MNPPQKDGNLARIGETMAAEYLESQGFHIIARNFRRKTGEIDLIALDHETLVFVEVKSRRSTRFGTGGEAITAQKQQRIARTAAHYLLRYPEPPACRFDAVIIDFSTPLPRIEHLKDAFRIGED
ncbi:MAG: YraN family protein [Bacteroidota bacterium]